MALNLAITGGTGFVGGHTLAAAVAAGHRVQALTRAPRPEQAGVRWIAGSLTDGTALAALCDGADAVIHIAGVTNADAAGFAQGNILGTAFLRQAAGTLPFVHVSSLSAREPALSVYGWSKLMGEHVARGAAGPVAMLRPPAVYGPGDREFLHLLKLARTGLVPIPAGTRAATIYGPDLAAALVALAADLAGPARSAGGIYEIDDGAGHHDARAMAKAMGAAVGRRVRAIPVGRRVLALAASGDSLAARLRGGAPRLSRDRASYMSHPDWSADSAPLLRLGIWQPRTSLPDGMAQTARWYREQGLL